MIIFFCCLQVSPWPSDVKRFHHGLLEAEQAAMQVGPNCTAVLLSLLTAPMVTKLGTKWALQHVMPAEQHGQLHARYVLRECGLLQA